MTTKKASKKKFHIEIDSGDFCYIGTDIEADTLSEARDIMFSIYKDSIDLDDYEMYLILERTIH